MDWEVQPTDGGNRSCERQRSYIDTPVKSKLVPELQLMTDEGHYIYKYGYYAQLRTQSAWRVPIIHAKLPKTPDATATPYEKGIYALCLMTLYRPHRSLATLIADLLGPSVEALSTDDAWGLIYKRYVAWRETIDNIAAPFLRRNAANTSEAPSFDDNVWWACMISRRLSFYDITFRTHTAEAFASPESLSVLP